MIDIIYKLPNELKNEFRLTTDEKNKTHIRIALLAGLLFYSAFGFLDKAIISDFEMVYTFWLIRFAIVLPISLIIFALTFSNFIYKWIQPLLGILVITGGLGINYMILVAPSPISEYYYAGLILIFIYSYSFLRINFKWATFSGWFIVFVYEINALYFLNIPTEIFINNNYFFISANLLGMFSNLAYEFNIRKEFHTSYKLELSNKEIKQNNLHLEDRVKERTKELEELNKKLINEIEERKNIESKLFEAKEKAENANQLKSEFLAQMSHEIRTPINTILNFSSLVQELTVSNNDPELQSSFTGINSASRRIVRTIDLILNTSELQLGTYEVSNREIDLAGLLLNIYQEYLNLANSKGLELKLIESKNVKKICTDDYAIYQIFTNLLDNSLKYTEQGFIEIILADENPNHYSIKIKDTGKGISNDYLPFLFEQFTQEEKGYTRKFEGSGLGLALVKKYCDLIGAKISVESIKGIGTTFEVLLNKDSNNSITN